MKKYKCKQCGETNDNNFYPNNKSRCKSCIIEYGKSRYQNLSEVDKQKYKNQQRDWQKENPFRVKYLNAKNRANVLGMEFDLTEEYVKELYDKQNGKCYYTGLPLDLLDNRDGVNTLSLDRLDSTKGYVKDNVVLCLVFVNNMKNKISEEEFLNIITKIYEYKCK